MYGDVSVMSMRDLEKIEGICRAAIINVYDFIDDFISLWCESLHG